MNDQDRELMERVTDHLRALAQAERKLVLDVRRMLPGVRRSVDDALRSQARTRR